ncbi:MAG: hypothetical protein M3033_11395 [Acidobacteriota bacterium]|nr:hypothetical protein [Acidobacteriota bacterium]
MKKMKSLAAVVLFLSMWLAGCAGEQNPDEKFEGIKEKLMASVGDLTRIPTQVELTDQPYIKGKIAVFQELEPVQFSGTKSSSAANKLYVLQNSYFREMQESYATTPEEVGTVALLDCQKLQKGVYKTDSGREYPAEVEDCNLTMVDRSKQAVIFKKKFEKTPSDERRAMGNFVGTQSAQEDVLQFLKGLPRK